MHDNTWVYVMWFPRDDDASWQRARSLFRVRRIPSAVAAGLWQELMVPPAYFYDAVAVIREDPVLGPMYANESPRTDAGSGPSREK